MELDVTCKNVKELLWNAIANFELVLEKQIILINSETSIHINNLSNFAVDSPFFIITTFNASFYF